MDRTTAIRRAHELGRPANRSTSDRSKDAKPHAKFWHFEAKADESAELWIYSEIGYSWWDDEGVTAARFAQELSAVKGPLTVRLNSPGGDVFDGLAIASLLRDHSANRGPVTGRVDGIAASIASVIAMACDTLEMGDYSQLMIHDAMAGAYGNAAEIGEVVDLLNMISDNIASVYADRAGSGTVKDWRAIMKGEKWYTADEAVSAGLADTVLTAKRKRCAACDGAGCEECEIEDADRKPCPECDGEGCEECDGTGMVEALMRHRANAWLNSYGRSPVRAALQVPSQDLDAAATRTERAPDQPTPPMGDVDWPGAQALGDAIRAVTQPATIDVDIFRAAVEMITSSARPDAPPAPVDLGPLPERAPAPELPPANPLADAIRGAVAIVATTRPEPPAPVAPEAELPALPPIRIDIADMRRAVREGKF